MKARTVFTGRIIELMIEEVTLPNGHTMEFEFVRHRGAAAVVPFREKDRVLLLRQYRHAVGGYLYEIPAGLTKANEDPQACAERELGEEAGYTAARWRKLGSIYTAPGFTNEEIHLFMAEDLSPCNTQLDPGEVLEVIEIPLSEVIEKIKDGTINDAKTITGLYMACLAREG